MEDCIYTQDGTTLTVNNSIIKICGTYGVQGDGGSGNINITNTLFYKMSKAMLIYESATIQNSIIYDIIKG